MTRYFGILEKEPGSVWSVWFPDFPGCTSAGKTAEEAIESASEALHLYVQDMKKCGEAIPAPQGFEAVDCLTKAQAEVTRVSVISFPYVEREAVQAVRINITINPAVLKSVDAAAKRIATNRSAFLEAAAREKIMRLV